MKKFCYLLIAFAAASLTSCSDSDNGPGKPGDNDAAGLFIVNNGGYAYSNSSLSFYDPETKTITNNVFSSANGVPLGDLAQSMTINGKTGWIVVNNSKVIFAIDVDTYQEKGRITGDSEHPLYPRYMVFVNDEKAYVSQINSNRIAIVNPKSYSITGYIEVPGMSETDGSTEMFVKVGKYVYCNCWSYQKEILKIDSSTDKIVDRIEIGVQPESIAYDGDNTLWVLTDGGGDWTVDQVGHEAPAIHAINLTTFKETNKIELTMDDMVSRLNYNDGYLYWLENGVQRMSVNATEAPAAPFIPTTSWGLYALTVDGSNGDIYVGDAGDYISPGALTRYDASGAEIQTVSVGIIPATFCWKK